MTSSTIQIDGGNGTTAGVYTGNFPCTTGECATIVASSYGSGSIGVHVIGTTNTSDPKQDIFAGSAFKSPFNSRQRDVIDAYYVEGDFSEISDGETDYTYLELKGLGLMKGDMPMMPKLFASARNPKIVQI